MSCGKVNGKVGMLLIDSDIIIIDGAKRRWWLYNIDL